MNDILLFVMLMALLALALNLIVRRKKIPKDPFALEAMTVIEECAKCRRKIQREFIKGDFIGKKTIKCQCGKSYRSITKIFFEKISEEESKWAKIVKPWE